jgi:predicted alpha-1,2-mannosidase
MTQQKLVNYINPLIGTDSGLVAPFVQVPHGMFNITPVTEADGNFYYYNNSTFYGFTGLFVPRITVCSGELQIHPEQYGMTLSHAAEISTPAYYSLNTGDLRFEATANRNSGIFRFSMPTDKESWLLIDLTTGGADYPEVSIIPAAEGIALNVSYEGKNLFYFLKFNQPVVSSGTWNGDEIKAGSTCETGGNIGIFVSFGKIEGTLEAAVSVSLIDGNQARLNLENQALGLTFDECRKVCEESWEKLLIRVRAESCNADDLVRFYTAFYRVFSHPYDITEDGKFRNPWTGFVESVCGCNQVISGGVLWDTFRTTHPFQQLIEPERQNELPQSFVRRFTATGELHEPEMIGHHSVSVIADMVQKGSRGFDIEKAYAGARDALLNRSLKPGTDDGLRGYYNRLGYVPCDILVESVSITLEECYDDWCLYELAQALGKQDDCLLFYSRAMNYLNVFDPEVMFMRRKKADGSWYPGFDPGARAGFTESNAWQQTWYVPHDMQGLINMLGGRDEFNHKLDIFFTEPYSPCLIGVSGIREGGGIGQFVQGNQPDWQVPYLYTYAGQPWKTQELTRKILDFNFGTGPDGLPGDDDTGSMSCCFAYASLGFFPVCPGAGYYILTGPLFAKSVIQLPGEKTFTIIAESVSRENIYIQSAELNGTVYKKPWISHADIAAGGELRFVMGNEPNTNWGADSACAPPSLTKEPPQIQVISVKVDADSIAPDLSSDSCDIPIYIVNAGQNVIISAAVANSGGAGSFEAVMTVDGQVKDHKWLTLKNGDVRNACFEASFHEPRRYHLSINKTYEFNIDVKAYDAPLQCHVSSAPNIISAGETAIFKLTVNNPGSFEKDEEIAFIAGDDTIEKCHVTLGPGRSSCLEFSHVFSEAGEYTVTIGMSAPHHMTVTDPIDPLDWLFFTTNTGCFYRQGDSFTAFDSGVDLWVPMDDYTALYKKSVLPENAEVFLRLDSREDCAANAKAGIMVKRDIGAAASSTGYVTLNLYADVQILHDSDSDGCNDSAEASGEIHFPVWLKLVRRGDDFTGFYSYNRDEWHRVGRCRVPGAQGLLDVGMFVTAMNTEQPSKAVFSDFEIK